MIVAVATEENKVAAHFGRCPEYTLYELGDHKVIEEQVIANPGHQPGFLPRFLANMGVKCVIAGGMGPRARSLFAEEGIETYVGVEGPVKNAVDAYLNGNLEPGPSTCEHRDGGHSCG